MSWTLWASSSGGTEEISDCADIAVKVAALNKYAPATSAYWWNVVMYFPSPLNRMPCEDAVKTDLVSFVAFKAEGLDALNWVSMSILYQSEAADCLSAVMSLWLPSDLQFYDPTFTLSFFWAAARLWCVYNMFRLVHIFQLLHRDLLNSSPAVHTVKKCQQCRAQT